MKRIILFIVISFLYANSNAQPWTLGGNTSPVLTTANNFLGSAGG
jgi:hypothetical protein